VLRLAAAPSAAAAPATIAVAIALTLDTFEISHVVLYLLQGPQRRPSLSDRTASWVLKVYGATRR
jgi:hypothetical protein